MKPEIYILKNDVLEVHISTLGATICRMIVENDEGEGIDTILGMEHAEDYLSPEYVEAGAYFGAAIGRYGNRIDKGQFILHGKTYQLAVNNGPNHLHGGVCGFDKKIWTVTDSQATALDLRYISPDGEENYPGTLIVDIEFRIVDKELRITYRGVTDKDCYVNLTHHPYFNLDPQSADIKYHFLKLYTDKYLKTNDLIPDGSFIRGEGAYDFTKPRCLCEVISQYGGLDDCFVFDNTGKVVRQAELFCEKSGITLYVCSDYPGLQVYTGRYLNIDHAKGGKHYREYAGVALEAQFWPDSPNHATFPSTLLVPGKEYKKTTVYGFE